MGTTLTGKNISASYLGLLKSTDNLAISSSAKTITDGAGNDLPIKLSTAQFLVSDGSSSAPTIGFSSDTDTGLYRTGSGVLGITSNGTLSAEVTLTGYRAKKNSTASAPNYTFIGDDNTGLHSLDADRLDFILGGNRAFGMTYATGVSTLGTLSTDALALKVNGSERTRILNTGQIKLNTYGSGTFTGTVTQRLGVDSSGNVIEIPIGGGAVDGSGTAGKIVKWSDSDTITDSIISESSSKIGIGTANPLNKIHILTGDDVTALFQSNDAISRIEFADNNTTGSTRPSIGASGNNTIFTKGSTEVMRLDSAGQLGLGTTSPNHLLDVESPGASMRVYNTTSNGNTEFYITTAGTTGASKILFGDTADADIGKILYRHNGNSMAFETNDSEAMRILSDGKVGIGSTTPSHKLQVYDATADAVLMLESGDGFVGMKFKDDDSDDHLYYRGDIESFYFTGARLGINNSSPQYALSVLSSDTQSYAHFINSSTGNTASDGTNVGVNGLDFYIWQRENASAIIGTNATERMRIMNDGDVGIGVNSPTVRLQISKGAIHEQLRVHRDINGDSTTMGSILLAGDDSDGNVTDYARIHALAESDNAGSEDGALIFSTLLNSSFSERMRLDSSGRLLINRTSSNGDILEVDGNANVYSARFNGNTTTGQSYGLRVRAGTNSSDKSMLVENTSGTDLFAIAGDGNATFGGEVLLPSGEKLSWGTSGASSIEGSTVSNKLQFRTNSSDAMIIDSSQQVGIGSTSPDAVLHVNSGTANLVALFESTDTASVIQMKDTTGTVSIESRDDFRFSNSSGELMRIDTTGNFGLGTTSPSEKLEVTGHIKLTNNGNFIKMIRNSSSAVINVMGFESGTDTLLIKGGSTSGTAIKFQDTSADVMVIHNSKVGIGTTSPSKKFEVDSGTSSDIAKFGNDNGGFVVGYTTNLASIDLSATSQKFRIRQGSSVPLTIDDSQNVGIGTTSPTQKLEVHSTIKIGETGVTGGRLISGDSMIFQIDSDNTSGTSSYRFRKDGTGDDGTELMRLTEDGRLGILSTAPTEKLEVVGNIFANVSDSGGFMLTSSSASGLVRSGSTGLALRTNTTDRVVVTSTGRTTIKRTGITGFAKNDMTLHIGFEGNNGQNNLIGFGFNGGTDVPAYIGYTTTSGSSNTKGDLIFATRSVVTDSTPTERARFTNDGGFRVGTTARIATSNVIFNQVTASDWGLNINSASTTSTHPFGLLINYSDVSPNNTTQDFIRANDSTTTRFKVMSNGGIANYQSNDSNLSDKRVKKDIVDAPSALNEICQFKVRNYKYKDQEDSKVHTGLIAQEVEKIDSSLIDNSGWGEDNYKAIYNTDVMFKMLKAIQEQQDIIKKLEARVEELEKEI
ncbi:MAG: putative tail fiber protein [Prokaryotic dsDNA virus sp.]|nr:MAG: putative tail fiber protein [Prokaryotic dsDNA virus sp.]